MTNTYRGDVMNGPKMYSYRMKGESVVISEYPKIEIVLNRKSLITSIANIKDNASSHVASAHLDKYEGALLYLDAAIADSSDTDPSSAGEGERP